jgi:hypothetical protein
MEEKKEIITQKDSPKITVYDLEIDAAGQVIKDKTITVVGKDLTECKKTYDEIRRERNK